jgi:hypothetical protein
LARVCILLRLVAGTGDFQDDQCTDSISLLQVQLEIGTRDPDHDQVEVRPDHDKTGFHDQVIYFPEQKLLVEACAKCGTTSIFEFIYREVFGTVYRGKDLQGQSTVQVPNPEWHGQMVYINPREAAIRNADSKVLSFGLIRDPRERVISSWKSKVACDSPCFETDIIDRSRIVPELFELVGNNPLSLNSSCLSFEDFLKALLSVNKQGKAQQLNRHLQPQHLQPGFEGIPLDKWDIIAEITSDNGAMKLAKHLGDKNASGASFPHEHASTPTQICPDGGLTTTSAQEEMLTLITKDEYEVLAPYLMSTSTRAVFAPVIVIVIVNILRAYIGRQ